VNIDVNIDYKVRREGRLPSEADIYRGIDYIKYMYVNMDYIKFIYVCKHKLHICM